MAIQGKGIFGGFRGKVGKIQGIRKNGKDIIQSLPKFSSRVLGFRPIVEPIDFIEVSQTTVSPGSAIRYGASLGYAFGARTTQQIKSTVGGYEWQVGTSWHLMVENFGPSFTGGQYNSYNMSIWHNTSNIVVYAFGSTFAVLSGTVVNEKFALKFSDGELWIWRDGGTGTLTKELNVDPILSVPFIFFSNLYSVNKQVTNCTVSRLAKDY